MFSVIKEPPYVVKESGYAGFVLPIDVYLKNKEEPKKISFQYDLQLQPSGPPISRLFREPRVFQNPSEDFRRKLIRGGGVGVDTPSEASADDSKSSSAVTKTKITESPIKKFKPGSSPNNTFSELFGTPIRRVNPEKKVAEVVKQKIPEVDSKDKKKLNKHSPHKDEKDSVKEKEKYSEKDRNKEREKTKDKSQKRPQSPVIIKPKEEHKKQHEEKEKKKEDHDEKKKRREEKDKKEKYKDIKEAEKQSEKEFKKEKKDSKEDLNIKKLNSSKPDIKPSSEKHNNEGEKDKERPEKEKHKHRHKKKEKEKNRDKEKHKKDKEKIEKDYKEKDKDREKNKKKHEDVKEKEEKRKKSRSPSPVPEKPKKGPLNALLDELGTSDSASALSDDEEDSIPSFKSLPKTTAKIVPEIKPQPVVNSTPKFKSTNSTQNENKEPEKRQEESPIKIKKDKSPGKKNKKSDREEKKHKNRSSSEREKEEEELERIKKEREERERLEKEQAEKERFERERLEAEKAKSLKKDKDSARKRKREKLDEPPAKSKKDSENNIAASQSVGAIESSDASDEIRKADKFTKEYVAQLRDLQHRIMTIEDNAELQKVVQVIAETGQYEITKKTFDFDLCALDCDTVRRLQEFFTT